MVQVAIPVRAVGVSKNRKKVNTFGNCIFHVYGEQTPLNHRTINKNENGSYQPISWHLEQVAGNHVTRDYSE
jgi:hypothetical protein